MPTQPIIYPTNTGPIPIRQLGTRLGHLYHWANTGPKYTHIWDLCCDHGRLGLHVFCSAHHTQAQVHLVDQVSGIMTGLRQQYAALNDGRLHFSHQNASTIQLPPNGPQLLLLAGIGGETLIDILRAIFSAHSHTHFGSPQKYGIDFMLSPNSHTYELRHFLRQNPLNLIQEAFVSDKGQHHEHLWLRHTPHPSPSMAISPAGHNLWQPFTQAKSDYLKKLIIHHANCRSRHTAPLATSALAAYQNILNANNTP